MGESDATLLEALGFTEQHERVYRSILRGVRGVDDIAELMEISLREVRAAVRSLEANGLISRAAGSRREVVAAPPGVALEALIRQRQESLDHARAAAREFEEHFRAGDDRVDPIDLVEVIVGAQAAAQRYLQMESAATQEVLAFDKPPYATPFGETTLETSALSRGVRVRAVYDQVCFELSGFMDDLEVLMSAGEEARVFRGLPMKMLIADRRFGLLLLSLEDQDTVGGALLLHRSALLEALIALWETIWERSTPLGSATAGAALAAEPDTMSSEDRRMLLMLVAGLKPQAVARQLGVVLSTVERRINRVMESLGADTRFQAGYLLAERALLRESDATATSPDSQ